MLKLIYKENLYINLGEKMLGEFKKKFICILLSLTMIIGLGVHSSFAASSTPEYCIVINTKTNKMGYYKKGKMVKQFSIATGKSSSPTPTQT